MRDFLNWIGQKIQRNLFGPIGSFFGNIDDLAKFARGESSGSSQVDSLINSMTGAGPTGKDEWVAEREDTTHQRTVADMQAAGLNPALMYGKGTTVDAASSGASPGTGISDILQLAMLPLQMKAISADIDKTKADTGKVLADTLGQNISNEYAAALSEAEIASRNARTNVDKKQLEVLEQDISESKAKISLMESQAKSETYRQHLMSAQAYLSESNAERVNALLPYEQVLMEAQADHENASAQYALVQKLYQQKLIDGGYIEAVIRTAKANMTVDEVEAWLSSDQYGREDEKPLQKIAHSIISGLNIAIKTISPIKTSRSSNVEVNKNVTVHK